MTEITVAKQVMTQREKVEEEENLNGVKSWVVLK